MQNGCLSGYVTDSFSNPIDGALVSINCGSLHKHNITNSAGFYKISDVPIVDYYWNVTASKKGYDTAWVDIAIDVHSTYDFALTNFNTILYVGGNGPNNYSKIQYAIDDASNGDTIYVYKGIYKERVKINKAIYLKGEDREYTIIDGMESGDVVSIKKSFASISNFTLQDLSIDEIHDGIVLYNNCCDITIENNIFIGCGISYFYTAPNIYSFRNTVRNNIVNGKPLIYLENSQNEIIDYPTGQVILSNCSNITVSYQNISHLHNGIVLFHSDDCTLYKNSVSNTGYGIVLYYSNQNNLSDNVLSENLIGIIYGASSNNNIFNNIIESNEKGIYDNISPYVPGSDSNAIVRNLIQNNSDGINLKYTKFVVIRYNSVEDNRYMGVSICSSSESFIEHNNFYRNLMGVSICSSSESFIEHNNFYRNLKSVYLMELNDTINIVIDGNYWGRARLFPKPILGLKRYGEGLFSVNPWVFFDWHPAKEPFDIGGI